MEQMPVTTNMIIDEESFDWDMDPLDLFSFNVLIFDNNEPDVIVQEVKHNTHLAVLISEVFGDDPVQTIVNNLDQETRARCPYFRIVMSEFKADSPINFKLRAFYNQIKMSSLNPRCGRAMAIGLHALANLDSAISMPLAFCTTSIDVVDYQLDSGVDLVCLKPCAQKLNPTANDLSDVAGLCLPYHVPENVQWCILSYLREPTATLIKDAMEKVCLTWDNWLHPMFVQREPRIPAHIARYYDVATVQSAIAGATRSRRATFVRNTV